ncbi:MAG: TetR/AcrR family transcriptional regulator [Bacteroidales bacterium]|nr:TetR/AcrR family transcriptional regulator [Bacteroidales bacterium]
MPRTKNQYKEIRESKKTLILDTALELFANQGYYTTSISKIALKAGISKGLMYNYFESKEELIKEIVYKGIDELLTNFDPNKDGILTNEEFEFFVHENFRVLKQNIHYWKLYFATVMQPPVHKLIQEKLMELLPGLLKTLVTYFKQKNVANPEAEALLFGALMDGISLNYIIDPENFPLEVIKSMIIDKFSHR